MVQVVSCTTIVAVCILEVSKVIEGGDLFQGKLRDQKKQPKKHEQNQHYLVDILL